MHQSKVPILRFKDENGNDYPDWEKKQLGELIGIRSGSSPSNFNLKQSGEYPFVKVEELNNCSKYQTFSRKYSNVCLLYTSPSPRDRTRSRMPSSA